MHEDTLSSLRSENAVCGFFHQPHRWFFESRTIRGREAARGQTYALLACSEQCNVGLGGQGHGHFGGFLEHGVDADGF